MIPQNHVDGPGCLAGADAGGMGRSERDSNQRSGVARVRPAWPQEAVRGVPGGGRRRWFRGGKGRRRLSSTAARTPLSRDLHLASRTRTLVSSKGPLVVQLFRTEGLVRQGHAAVLRQREQTPLPLILRLNGRSGGEESFPQDVEGK